MCSAFVQKQKTAIYATIKIFMHIIPDLTDGLSFAQFLSLSPTRHNLLKHLHVTLKRRFGIIILLCTSHPAKFMMFNIK